MRKLMWFTIGFALAVALCAYVGFITAVLIALAVCAIGAVAASIRWKKLRIPAFILAGAAAAMVFFLGYRAVYLQPASAMDGTEQVISAEVTDYSYETDFGGAVEASIRMEGRQYRAVVYLDEYVHLIPSDRIEGLFRLRCTTGGREEATCHRGSGILLLFYPESELNILQTEQIPAKYYPAVLRRTLLAYIDGAFPADTACFAKALLLGEKSDLPYEISTAFKISGISHIIAVSGLHVSILFAIVTLITGKRRLLMALIGMPLLLLFAAVAGFTPSVTRACLMQMLFLIAMLCNKEYDPPTSLAFAALTMLAVNPYVITSVSFQLSVGCMAGIFLFSKRITGWINGFSFWKDWKGKNLKVRFRNWISGSVGITLGAMFFTTPLVAYYFGAVSLVGILTNLLTLGPVSLCFYGTMAVCLLSGIWPGLAGVAGWCISWVMRYVIAVAKLLSAVPLAAVYTQSVFIIGWLALCYALILIFLCAKKRQSFILISCGVCGLCIALMLSWAEPLLDDTRMTVLDVGQGQCVILQSGGRTFLIDCGGDSDTEAADLAADTLLSQGICRLDGVIVTHYDRDHAGGVGYLLSRIPADAVFLPASPDEDGMLETILPYCDGKEVFVDLDLKLQWEDASLEIFAPILSTSDNERGLCVLFGDENCDILITGDLSSLGEKILLAEKDIPELTALVAGHHGSKNSTCRELLQATEPKYVFISAGKDNYYGHPHPDVLQRLEEFGCCVYRTDRQGTIIFRR